MGGASSPARSSRKEHAHLLEEEQLEQDCPRRGTVVAFRWRQLHALICL